jgi:hypothetical protein
MNGRNPGKIYTIENKIVRLFLETGQRKKAGGKNEGIFHYVIENKWCKLVRKRSFHYVYENKYSYSHASIILIKVNRVKGSRRWDAESRLQIQIQDSGIRRQILDPQY